jgi:hypothetical protein
MEEVIAVMINDTPAPRPFKVLNTMTFGKHKERTTLKLRGNPLDATKKERKTLENGDKSMQPGLRGHRTSLMTIFQIQ